MCGAVNIACRASDANPLLLAVARALVQDIRTILYEAAAPRQRRLLDASLTYRAATTRPVVAIDNQIMIVDEAAAALGLDRAELWALVTEAGPTVSQIVIRDDLMARVYPVTERRLEGGVVLVLHPGYSRPALTPTRPALLSAELRHRKSALRPLEQAEADVIQSVLFDCGGNKSEAAERLGISRGTLYQRLRRYRIDV